jgi:uncharacterized protein YijF (DUF1287 family)
MKKRAIFILIILLLLCIISMNFHINNRILGVLDNLQISLSSKKAVDAGTINFAHDMDKDGLDDMDDIIQGAREEVLKHTRYHSAYYAGGYPPSGEGTCTDVIGRALLNAGYDLKQKVDMDISKHTDLYFGVHGRADPNIDFRRVANLQVFFRRHADMLTTKVMPWDSQNARQWQRGDIVIFDKPFGHIAIISDRRRRDGVPYIIHNCGPIATEENLLQRWPSPIRYHFRYPKNCL